MASFNFWYLYLLIAPVFAQVETFVPDPCTPDKHPFHVVVIDNQSNIDQIANCTTINGDLYMTINFTASFPNLVKVRGWVSMLPLVWQEEKISSRQHENVVPSPLGFSFPRLETIESSLSIRTVNLQTLELPSLLNVSSIFLDTPALETWTMADSLHTDSLMIRSHNISTLNFPNLANISTIDITSGNKGSVYFHGTMSNATYGTRVRVEGHDTSFTSELQNTKNTSFALYGCQSIAVNAERLSKLSISLCPKLESLMIPSLLQVNDALEQGSIFIEANENLKEIAFPNLVSIESDLIVRNNSALADFGRGFDSLESVGSEMVVEGNFTSLHFPKVVNVETWAWIRGSSDAFNCSGVEDNFVNSANVTCTGIIPAPTTSNKPHKSGLTYPAKIGLGVGIAVFVVLSIGLGCGFCLWRSHRHPDRSGRAATISSNLLRLWAKESFQKKPPSYPLQDFPPRRGDEPLPSYQPRPSSTATTLAGDARDVSRPGTGTQPPQHLGVLPGRSPVADRPVSPVSPVSVSAPSPAHVSSQPGANALPPNYWP